MSDKLTPMSITYEIPHKELKPIYVSPQSLLNEDVVKNIDDMFSFASPRQYRDALLEIYHMYILHEHQKLPADFADIASRMILMMDFLKACEE
jgi:uncharacterized protein YllA (UPF0747 family)